jgi:hypothetical protein
MHTRVEKKHNYPAIFLILFVIFLLFLPGGVSAYVCKYGQETDSGTGSQKYPARYSSEYTGSTRRNLLVILRTTISGAGNKGKQ